jgi:hypothetical protein
MSSITGNIAAARTLTTGQPARVAARVLTGLGTVFLAFDSITHLIREGHVVAANEEMGGPTWFPVLCGAVMAAILVLYHLRRTAVLGAVLIVGYLGGACAASLLTGQPLVNCAYAILMAVVMWAGLWPRDARLRAILGSR